MQSTLKRPLEQEDIKQMLETINSRCLENQRKAYSEAAGGLEVELASEVRVEPVQWLWPGFLALGSLHALVGDPEAGKTYTYLKMAADLAGGVALPGCEPAGPIEVLIRAGEDRRSTIAQRLRYCGADEQTLKRIRLITKRIDREGVGLVDEYLRNNPQIKLVIFDPVSTFLDGKDEYRNSDVRMCIDSLGELADKHGVAVLFLRHLSKAREKGIVDRITGSTAFKEVPRIVLACVQHQGTGRRALGVAKSNISQKPISVGYIIGDSSFTWEEPDEEVDIENWSHSVPTGKKERPRRVENTAKLEEVASWLLAQLTYSGKMSQRMIEATATEAGLNIDTLKAARSVIGARVTRHDGEFHWELPEDPAGLLDYAAEVLGKAEE